MSSHVFHEIFLHLTWHTKDNSPLITPVLEPLILAKLTHRCEGTKGVILHGINAVADHVHLAVDIEPSVTISDLVGQLKGGSSHDINEIQRMKALEWQRGFGVVSFGKGNLPWVLEYIACQKEHHARGTYTERLERIDPDAEG
jgi:REP element-mobilizing transposase RayT